MVENIVSNYYLTVKITVKGPTIFSFHCHTIASLNCDCTRMRRDNKGESMSAVQTYNTFTDKHWQHSTATTIIIIIIVIIMIGDITDRYHNFDAKISIFNWPVGRLRFLVQLHYIRKWKYL